MPRAGLFKRAIGPVLQIEPSYSKATVHKPDINPDIPRTKKNSRILVATVSQPKTIVVTYRTKDNRWRGLKTNAAIPSFMDISNESRSEILFRILLFGNACSLLVSEALGFTPRQIGQIRRWNLPWFRQMTNQHLRNARNINSI
jgi:hypothetical protein